MALTGEDILNTLNELKGPASVTEITAHLSSKKNKGSQTALTEAAKELIEAGVRFGCIVEEENKFRCKEEIKAKETPKDVNKESVKTVTSNNEMGSSSGRKEKSENMKRKAEEIEYQQVSSDDADEDDVGDGVLSDAPSSRRRRSRSRRRSQSGKRHSSRRKRRYQ